MRGDTGVKNGRVRGTLGMRGKKDLGERRDRGEGENLSVEARRKRDRRESNCSLCSAFHTR